MKPEKKHLHCFVITFDVFSSIVTAWAYAHRIAVSITVRRTLWRRLQFLPSFLDYVRFIDEFLTHYYFED